ncbi:UNVERIFIED_CONTAM: hypothetical protein Sradi_0743800 [Sesamum radiatum]|uniref:Retroviral polymerase SH3-like domain-containing protein n=1 Tax=Sesamum radiatum TaxID=300843 RepID=A0AAW2VPK6_SESRA
MDCATYVINRMTLSPINMRTPYAMIFGEKPNMKYSKIFGSICYVHVQESRRSKLDLKARKCIFIGCNETKNGWKYMDLETHKFTVSQDVVFDEISSFYDLKVADKDKISLPMSPPDISHSLVMPYEERGSINSDEEREEQ